jgi:hypothetical protein
MPYGTLIAVFANHRGAFWGGLWGLFFGGIFKRHED